VLNLLFEYKAFARGIVTFSAGQMVAIDSPILAISLIITRGEKALLQVQDLGDRKTEYFQRYLRLKI
jgi:hypothetical protein